MGLEDELGTLEAGKRADLVVVDGDPLDFATLAERVSAVYQDGVQVSA
jgi:imidazolonepropionase-like amidohydrolase